MDMLLREDNNICWEGRQIADRRLMDRYIVLLVSDRSIMGGKTCTLTTSLPAYIVQSLLVVNTKLRDGLPIHASVSKYWNNISHYDCSRETICSVWL